MKRLLLPAVISALMIAEVHAESFTISDIRVNGLQRVSAGSVLARCRLMSVRQLTTVGWSMQPERCFAPVFLKTSSSAVRAMCW